ncbi:putative protein OS=Ureibacillus acetophenoni OX=614649 GN=SAMN05877842_103311 PE=4 SV=1 [Ureibacillus acetophenoni]|uniref:hypothetical protein n=1 Tax=Ureibacillus sp. MALMAid1270 TaxID=3411629 RepID=UPI003BA5A1C9
MNIHLGKLILFGFLTIIVIICLAIYSGFLTYEILKPYLVEEVYEPFKIKN